MDWRIRIQNQTRWLQKRAQLKVTTLGLVVELKVDFQGRSINLPGFAVYFTQKPRLKDKENMRILSDRSS